MTDNNINQGIVYWITGLAGAGKTTIGRSLYRWLKQKHVNAVFLDGDVLRGVFGNSLGYSPDERLKLAMQYARLCKMLSDQGLVVVCATISMFPVVWEWNRHNISGYKEIYLRVPIQILINRDHKQLYSRALSGEIKYVTGIDIDINEPEFSDIIIENDGKKTTEEIVDELIYYFRGI